MLEKDTGWEAGKCYIGVWKLLRQGRNIFFSIWPIHPHCSFLLLPPPVENSGASYKWEKTTLLTWDQTMRKIVNIPSSFMLLFWGRVEFWGVWAEGEERNERLGMPCNSQTHYIPHILTGCDPQTSYKEARKNPRIFLFRFKGQIGELWEFAPSILFLNL